MSSTTTPDAVVLSTERDLNLWQAAPALYAACRAAAIALATVAVDNEQVSLARRIVDGALDRVSEFDDADTGGAAAAAAGPHGPARAERC